MAFLYSILPEYTRDSDILTDNNIKGKVKTLEEFMNIIDEEIFDIISDSVKEILSFGSIYEINDEYLPYLGYLLGYKWNFRLDSAIQRNILANILELYKRKGTKFSFNFSLYHLDPSVTLYEPYKDIFILNKSGFDEFDYENYPNFIWKIPVNVATTENIILNGIQIIDNIRVNINDRVLVKNQDNPIENGIYIVKEENWVRSEDADSELKLSNALYYVKNGLINKNKGWICIQADFINGIIFEQVKFKKRSKKYHLSSREYYSWGILVIKIDNLSPEIYDLLSMIKPAGWKILIELKYGLYYNLHFKVDGVVRNNYINNLNLSILDFGEDKDYYINFLNSIYYYTFKTFIEIVLMGRTFDLYGNYFNKMINNYLTFQDIDFYNLYYESENNDYTLLRYSTHYTGYINTLGIVFMGHIFDLNGHYFDHMINNSLTLNDIDFYNLYYESENNDYTLLRYSTNYTYTKYSGSIVFMGQTFDLKGNYFDHIVDNYLTLNDIDFYNLYYESEDNNYTLLRYSTNYSNLIDQ